MPKIELSKIYNSSSLTESGGKWTDFDGFQGSEVELFLKDKLEDSVVSFTYYNTGFETPDTKEVLNNVLVGYNAFGTPVCYERIINADPTYTYTFGFQRITIGSTPYNAGTSYGSIQVNKSDNLTASLLFNYVLTGSIAGSEFNEASPQSVTFKWFKDLQGNEIDATLDTLTRTVTPGEGILVDITKMFDNSFANRYLGVCFKLPKSDAEVVQIFDQPFTLRKLELSYNGNFLINTPTLTNLNLEGTSGEDLSTYKLEYYLDSITKVNVQLDGSAMTSSSIKFDLPNLSEGPHDVFVRAVSGGNLTSNYIQISFIYLKTSESILTDAIAMVSEVPNEIDNCNLSKFFKVITTANLSGNIEIIALKSNNLGNIRNINTIEAAKASKFLFKEINLSLLSTDASLEVDYTSYIEVAGNEDSTEYLKMLIKDGNGVRSLIYYQLANNNPSRADYKMITIKNPKEGSTHLQYTVGSILDFSQISNGNVFTDLSSNLDSSDGLLLETVKQNSEDVTLTTFKVSPTTGVFALPKKLISAGQVPLHKGNFSIELMFKTYGVNDLDDKILTIGNITLCPKHIFVNYLPNQNTEPHHTVNASRADFRKEEIQHLMITYDHNYKPSTYEKMYDMFFTSGSTSYSSSAKAYPCLKFYVNGVINRIISISDSTICGESDLKFQIHPTNSNVNFYIVRTYDKALTNAEILKNYISSMSKLVDKQAFYLDNDILYMSTDFTAGLVESKKDIINTISLGKCINKFKSVSNPNKVYTDRKVLLLAVPDGILPPYYGNRKNDEPKAAFLVHYPEVVTDSGVVPSDYSGRLAGGKVKAQGSSAKKYMIHNTSYSKFVFTPESQFNVETPTTYEYYKMPGSDIEITKLVGKVNYASSMQSHKQGACKLFHEGYVQSLSGLDTSWMNGGRKAVLEDEFLYFWVNVPKDDLETLTWDYFREKDAQGNKTGDYNFENCRFLGFQTWGSAKGDKKTSGYGDETPHYLMLEGADNDNSVANFKTPWAGMQIWGNHKNGVWTSANSTFIQAPAQQPDNDKNYFHQFSGGTQDPITKMWTPDYLTGLLINDETIVFNPGLETETSSDKKADALDVDFGFTEGEGYVEKGKWYLDGEEVEEDTPNAVKADEDNLFFVFDDGVDLSVNRFAQFYNLVYTFDFSSLLYIPDGSIIDGNSMTIKTPVERGNTVEWEALPLSNNLTGKPVYQYKLVFGANCEIRYTNKTTYPDPGDIYRWEKAWPNDVAANYDAKWVSGGLYYNQDSEWEKLNISDICTWYCNAALGEGTYPAEYAFFAKEEYANLKAIGDNGNYKYINSGGYSFSGYNTDGVELTNMQACMAEAFKIVMYEFLDVNDVAYHSAFVKFVAGTDNRAKNTYWQIVGPIYTSKYALQDGSEVDIVKVSEIKAETTDEGEETITNPLAKTKLTGYIKDGVLYEVKIEGETVTETGNLFDTSNIKKSKKVYYKKTGKGDFKIRLYADDLDTIFKTDNNGLQVKPYYLLEPPYNRDLEELWGDMHSGFFYNFDLTFYDTIKTQLSNLLTFATGGEWPDAHTTKLYQYFFSILKNLPAISYNHLSEIYYESPQVFWQNNGGTAFYKVFQDSGVKSWQDFNNNKVWNPVSLSHGSCYEAEVEYLRDRVLLLSTYTNSAKNKTDVGILLSGGSAVTGGSEVVISSLYTSFILYIYPIINNIQSSKDYTSLLYDPLLDYMNWVTVKENNQTISEYRNIDLIYNVALPNEPLDLSVKFSTSGLTTQSYWTSTDLYRTIHITSGAESFSSLFSFPNASTVISLDPAYQIEIPEGKEVDVVNHLESIEHLVLQAANISSQGLDFTGCNRLKTLVLGSTQDNLTDAPEGTAPEDAEYYAVKFVDVLDPTKFVRLHEAAASTGFSQVILPKSSSVEQVILPNCITVANINYYPNLQKLEFNSGTQLVNLTIDGRNPNSIIEYVLTNFVGPYTTNLEITNVPGNFWLTEATCRKLTQIANVKIVGNVFIGDGVNQAEIDWSTKRMLVEKFGNIIPSANNKNVLTFTYKDKSFRLNDITYNNTGTIESSGAAPIQLNIPGNTIPLTSDGKHLKLTYSIVDSSGKTPSKDDIKFVDEYTPQLIIKNGLRGVYTMNVKVFNETTSTTYPIELTVGFYAPKVGDFAYANGSFSSVCDPSLGIVGVVFYSKKDNATNTHDVRILSALYSSTDMPLGPANYAVNWNTTGGKKLSQSEYIALLTALGIDTASYIKDVVTEDRAGGLANGTIKYDSVWSSTSNTALKDATLPNTNERIYQKTYITRAESYMSKISGLSYNSLESENWSKPTKEGKERFEQILLELGSKLTIDVGTSSFKSSNCGGFLYAMYPAFLKALYYEPQTNIPLSGKGIDQFGIGNWYIPDSRELELIIYHRINSAISNSSQTLNYWNSIEASGIDVEGGGSNVFSANTFSNIAFLLNTKAQISSECSNDGAGLTYGLMNYYGSSDPQWSLSVSLNYSAICARDDAHDISPVCRVELIEPSV